MTARMMTSRRSAASSNVNPNHGNRAKPTGQIHGEYVAPHRSFDYSEDLYRCVEHLFQISYYRTQCLSQPRRPRLAFSTIPNTRSLPASPLIMVTLGVLDSTISRQGGTNCGTEAAGKWPSC